MSSDRRFQEITGVFIFLFSLMLLLALASFSIDDYRLLSESRPVGNLMGPFGAWISNFLHIAFGISSYILVAIMVLAGWHVVKKGNIAGSMERIFALSFLLVSFAALCGLFGRDAVPQRAGGYVGLYLTQFCSHFMGNVGGALVVVVLNLAALLMLGVFSLSSLFIAFPGGKLQAAVRGAFIMLQRRRDPDAAPLTRIDEEMKKNARRAAKPPWVVKRRVHIYRGRVMGEEEDAFPRGIGLLEFRAPSADGERREEGSCAAYADVEMNADGVYETEIIEARRSSDFADWSEAYEPEAATESRRDGISQTADVADDAKPHEVPEIHEEEHPAPVDEGEIEYNEKPVEPPVATDRLRFAALSDDDTIPEAISAEDREAVAAAATVRSGATDRREAESTRAKKGAGEIQQTFDFGDEETGPRVFETIAINRDYIIPAAFLQPSSASDAESWKSEIIKNSELLVNTLNDFGIESRVVNVNRGPVITLYEMQIAPGIKVNRIVGLSDDIAMALSGSRVRIVAPIPGKSAIGVEVPNRKREMVNLGDIITAKEYQSYPGSLKVSLGKDILGKPVTLDLKKLPHLLIAGATGSGKSVCVNAIITSLIYNYDPNYVRFILVDPKMVELQLYNGIPHLLTPVIVEPHVAPKALKWAMYEMERRYRLLSQINTRDIERYNQKVAGYGDSYERLPYIVVIMDELADLMMVAQKEIEGFITRIAQKARAVGIHLVLATQRPSVDVITGIIKANFPARIAFQVAQKTDSRTIIDQNGAEKLLGKGDMLYQSPTSSFPVRIQGAYVSEDEIQVVVKHLRSLGSPNYIDIDAGIFEEELSGDDDGDDDELFVEALKIVEETKKASASYLQRRLSIGYNRAARIIELMEDRGYIGAQQGSKPREVYV
ncbi:MAG TPA: DNA translocase FtsK [Spirochaetota bacterium]|nr:DNA translocase FtsK [Spirochaetota bacterium]